MGGNDHGDQREVCRKKKKHQVRTSHNRRPAQRGEPDPLQVQTRPHLPLSTADLGPDPKDAQKIDQSSDIPSL